jgi:hypothetical protein
LFVFASSYRSLPHSAVPGGASAASRPERDPGHACVYDGEWILRTDTALSASEVALKYEQLWLVEAILRTMKSQQLDTRPIFHQNDGIIRGHVFCSFLALVLGKALQDRLEAKGQGDLGGARILADLDALQEIELTMQGKVYRLRTETKGMFSLAVDPPVLWQEQRAWVGTGPDRCEPG